MRDLPSRGRCHAAFLLAYSARVRDCADVSEWVLAALDKPTHMASSLDLSGTALLLIDTGLARVDGKIINSRGMGRLNTIADLTTLKAIARLLLSRRPPDWLRTVVVEGRLATELIPSEDLDAISWLGVDLEPIITSVHRDLYGDRDDELRKLLGDAGELAIMSAFRLQGLVPRHVALVSDRFGYDIEVLRRYERYGYEVKTAVSTTAGRILLSRHEFEVASAMDARWRLIQVTFSTKVLAVGRATAQDVVHIRELTSDQLRSMAPVEQATFRWNESAEFRPCGTDWLPSDLVVASDFITTLEAAWS